MLPGDVAHSQGDQVDTNFTRGAPYKICEGKKRPKFSPIFNNFRLWSQISPERINVSIIRKVLDQLHFIPYWAKKNWWTLVQKPKSYRYACWPTQLDFFRETIFQPIRGAGLSNFTLPTSPINCISSRTWGAGRPQVGLCPIFLVYGCFYYIGNCDIAHHSVNVQVGEGRKGKRW